jgi:hypothetical protein
MPQKVYGSDPVKSTFGASSYYTSIPFKRIRLDFDLDKAIEEIENPTLDLLASVEPSSRLRNCPDCGVEPGNIHNPDCDVEMCSVCGLQLLMCEHEEHDNAFARWSGFWPGSLEAEAMGIDLNQLVSQYRKVFFIKPKD